MLQLPPARLVHPNSERPSLAGSVRVVVVSDTHGLHDTFGPLPDGDILIHCGDFTDKGTAEEVASFDRWLSECPHLYKVVVSGNHDVSAFSTFDPARAAELLPSATHYLDCGHIELCGLRIFGISWKRQFGAANLIAALEQRRPHLETLPIDILVCHEPPSGTLDGGYGCDTIKTLMVDDGGCARVNLFGHVHEARGSVWISGERLLMNCANVQKHRVAALAPAVVFELTPPPGDDDLAPCDDAAAAATPSESKRSAETTSSSERSSRQLVRLGTDPPLSLTSHCLVVPGGAAPTAVVEATERLSAAIAAVSCVQLLTVSEGRWAQNRGFHASVASSTRCRTPLTLGCSAAWLVDCKLLSETTIPTFHIDSMTVSEADSNGGKGGKGGTRGTGGGWVRTVQYVDSEVVLEPGMPPTQLMATALLVGGSSTASIVTALDWTSTVGLARLARGAQSIEADFPEVIGAAAGSLDDNDVAAVATPSLEGQRVEIVEEGLMGLCLKHLVDEGRLRIKVDGDASKTVWRTADCVHVIQMKY